MGEMVAIGTSSLTPLNQIMVEAGFRAPLVSRAQDLFILDIIKQGVCGRWKNLSDDCTSFIHKVFTAPHGQEQQF